MINVVGIMAFKVRVTFVNMVAGFFVMKEILTYASIFYLIPHKVNTTY